MKLEDCDRLRAATRRGREEVRGEARTGMEDSGRSLSSCRRQVLGRAAPHLPKTYTASEDLGCRSAETERYKGNHDALFCRCVSLVRFRGVECAQEAINVKVPTLRLNLGRQL